jgi:hypothetical protein
MTSDVILGNSAENSIERRLIEALGLMEIFSSRIIDCPIQTQSLRLLDEFFFYLELNSYISVILLFSSSLKLAFDHPKSTQIQPSVAYS